MSGGSGRRRVLEALGATAGLAGSRGLPSRTGPAERTDVAGAVPGVEWEYTYDGDYVDVATRLVETSDRGFLLAGETDYSTTTESVERKLLLAKVSAAGEREWARTYAAGIPRMVSKTTDGEFVLAGRKDGRAWLAGIAPQGDRLWERT